MWKPISTYDALRTKPKMAVFYFRSMVAGNRLLLPPTVGVTRYYGHRECTHWMPLPVPPDENVNARGEGNEA